MAQQAREAEQARKASERDQAARARKAAKDRASWERDAKRRSIERNKREADAKTRALEDDVTALEHVLADGLRRDPYLDPESLKEPLRLPAFAPGVHGIPLPVSDPGTFLPSRPGALAQMVPGASRRYEEALAAGRVKYEAAMADHERREGERQARLRTAEAEHQRQVVAIREQVAEQHAAVDALVAGLASGQARALREYFRQVLAARPRLDGVPNQQRAVFLADSDELIVEFELPTYDRIPQIASYQYVQATDTLKPTLRGEKKRKELYQRVIAQLTLLTVRDLLDADRNGKIEAVVANGMVDAIDPTTGKPVRPCVVSVCVTRDSYQGLDLARVDPVGCLTKLAAQLSPSPEELSPVQPILAQAFLDAHYVEEMDVLTFDRTLRQDRGSCCVERGQALRLVVEFAPGWGWEVGERLQADLAVVVAPGSRYRAVDQEGRDRVRGLGVEDEAAVALGQDLGAPGVDQQGGVPGGEQARRCWCVRVG